MPHEPGHIDSTLSQRPDFVIENPAANLAPPPTPPQTYTVYGTNESYSGLTVEIGGYLYTTVGGALEGDSLQLVATSQMNRPTINTMGAEGFQENPVVRLFNAPSSPRYQRPNGQLVPVGAQLHEHADGTIMTEHKMGGTPPAVIVTPLVGTRQTTTPRRQQQRAQSTRRTTPTQTRATRMGGSSGGSGGGGGY